MKEVKVTRFVRKKVRIVQRAPTHLEDVRWWKRYCENGLLVHQVEDARVGQRMGRYYLKIAMAVERKLLTEEWVKKMGITKSVLVAERVLKGQLTLRRGTLQSIANPKMSVATLKEQLRVRRRTT